MRILLSLFLLLAGCQDQASANISQRQHAPEQSDMLGRNWHVVGVTDGDTIKVLSRDKVLLKVRLYGIDAPEKKQPFGAAAKKHLSELIFGKDVAVDVVNIDRYGRSVAKISTNPVETINEIMIQDGFAWAYVQYLKGADRAKYSSLESEARFSKRGLWVDSDPTPPWNYRKTKKHKRSWR